VDREVSVCKVSYGVLSNLEYQYAYVLCGGVLSNLEYQCFMCGGVLRNLEYQCVDRWWCTLGTEVHVSL
jgi:hypothetical protein